MKFKILAKDGKARVGKLTTPHGIIETPNFNPVGTQAAVKALSPKELNEIGVQIVLGNTYHLMLRPGADLIEKFGGLHKFMGWDKPIMTDSGGFQVFSLGVALEHGSSKVVNSDKGKVQSDKSEAKPRLNKITEEGVTFQSHIDGSKHILTPEKSIKIQRQLGADLIVAFDDHESSKHSKAEMQKSIELTEQWELRSLEAFKRLCHSEAKPKNLSRMRVSNELRDFSLITPRVLAPYRSGTGWRARNDREVVWDDKMQLMYGVVHGGTYKDLRIRSAKFTDENFEAIAIGGIYGDHQQLCQIIEWVTGEVSEEKPRHLLGIGEVQDLFNGIERGMDLFDCVAPTRRARFGSLYISPKNGGKIENSFTMSIRQSRFTTDKKPIDPGCNCYTCKNFSRGYLRHLFMAGEILYHQLATCHNVYFITNLVNEIRESIKENRFNKLKGAILSSP